MGNEVVSSVQIVRVFYMYGTILPFASLLLAFVLFDDLKRLSLCIQFEIKRFFFNEGIPNFKTISVLGYKMLGYKMNGTFISSAIL